MKKLLLLLATLALFGCKESSHIDPGVPAAGGNLVAYFRSNTPDNGLSGIASLFHNQDPSNFSPFDGENSGLNFEHIIAGHDDPRNAFTPRTGALTFNTYPNGADLIRQARDEAWGIPWIVKYRIVAPHYIDFEFTATITDPSQFQPEGYAAFFFASYMTGVATTEINFRGYPQGSTQETWVTSSPTSQPGENYIAKDAQPLVINNTNSLDLLDLRNEPHPRIAQPFYYGRLANNYVYSVMFDRLFTADDEIRFTVFRWQAGKGKPAWDFVYLVKNLALSQIGFKGRLIYKPWVSQEDIQQEYDSWKSDE